MYFVDNNTGVPVMPPVKEVLSSTPLFFTEGGNGVPPTWPGPDWFNIIQSELINFLAAYGVNPEKSNLNQLQAAVEEAIRQKATESSALLTAIAALVTSANQMPYFTGEDEVGMTALTAFAREILAQTDAAGVLSKLGLGDLPDFGTAAALDVATAAQMQTGTATNLLPSVAAVMSLLPKRVFAQNDFIRIPDVPGGLMIQWGLTGQLPAGTGIGTVTFPTPYPNNALTVMAIRSASAVPTQQEANPTITALTKASFNINIASAGATPAFWISFGG